MSADTFPILEAGAAKVGMELAWGTEPDDELALQEIKDEYHHSVFLLLAFPCVIPIAFFGMMTLFALVSVVVPREVYDSVDVGNEMYLIYLKPPDKTFAVRAYKKP